MSDPTFLHPHALQPHPIVRETRLIRDLTMAPVDVEKLSTPSYERLQARSVVARDARP